MKNLVLCIQSSWWVSRSLVELSQYSNRLLNFFKIVYVIGFRDDDQCAAAVRLVCSSACLLSLFPYITLQNSRLVRLVPSVRRTYLFHGCNVDIMCNLDSAIDELVQECAEADTEAHYMIEHTHGFPERQPYPNRVRRRNDV